MPDSVIPYQATIQLIIKFIAKSAILDAKAKVAENATIISTIGPLTSGETNPVLADAKKRAAEYVVGCRMPGDK